MFAFDVVIYDIFYKIQDIYENMIQFPIYETWYAYMI